MRRCLLAWAVRGSRARSAGADQRRRRRCRDRRGLSGAPADRRRERAPRVASAIVRMTESAAQIRALDTLARHYLSDRKAWMSWRACSRARVARRPAGHCRRLHPLRLSNRSPSRNWRACCASIGCKSPGGEDLIDILIRRLQAACSRVSPWQRCSASTPRGQPLAGPLSREPRMSIAPQSRLATIRRPISTLAIAGRRCRGDAEPSSSPVRLLSLAAVLCASRRRPSPPNAPSARSPSIRPTKRRRFGASAGGQIPVRRAGRAGTSRLAGFGLPAARSLRRSDHLRSFQRQQNSSPSNWTRMNTCRSRRWSAPPAAIPARACSRS